MSRMILLVALTASMAAVSIPSQAQISQEPLISQKPLARAQAPIPVAYHDDYGHWIKCADAAGMCGVTTG